MATESMRTFIAVDGLRAQVAEWKRDGLRVAFVPTMGNLHAGHHSLVELARQHAERVIASVFVNPTQFGPNEDFARYPRTPEADAEGLVAHGCDALFLPTIEAMYPFGAENAVSIRIPGITGVLEGAHRPGHFDGVATVVARLFNLVRPDAAVFGRKDYQQLQVIRYLVQDLAFPIEIVEAATRRESDGLAMSSRNQYLSGDERRTAALIYETLQLMRDKRASGRPLDEIEAKAANKLKAAGFEVDYAVVRRADLSEPAANDEPGLVALIAAKLGRTRLIDNLDLDRG